MGVDMNCYIRGYYVDDSNKVKKIVDLKDEPEKWSQVKENYWNAYIDFISRNEYYYKDFYVIVEHRSSDYGLHSVKILKNGVSVFNAETDDRKSYKEGYEIVYKSEHGEIIVLYRQGVNDFLITISNEK